MRGRRYIKQLGFELLERPLYNSDLATSDFYLFSSMKERLRESKSTLEYMCRRCPEWLCTIPQNVFQDGITKSVKTLIKCMEIEENYAQKYGYLQTVFRNKEFLFKYLGITILCLSTFKKRRLAEADYLIRWSLSGHSLMAHPKPSCVVLRLFHS